MKKFTLCFILVIFAGTKILAQSQDRALWVSVNGTSNASLGDYKNHNDKLLISWRMLPGDDSTTGFDLYRSIDGKKESKRNSKAITDSTCWQEKIPSYDYTITYRLTYHGSDSTLSTHTIEGTRLKDELPYVEIPLKETDDVCDIDTVKYGANDISVGDLDGDGEYEIVVKRLQTLLDKADLDEGTITTLSDGSGAGSSHPDCLHPVIWDAYKLDGTFLWRIKGGPAMMLGNSSAFAIADFDGDGRAEMAIRTGEGTVFGDGTEIGDTNNDGKIDYRTWTGGWIDHYSSDGPEFLSIIDGTTGAELARADFIARETSESWGDNYFKRANSLRVGVGCFDGELPSVVLGRGVYNRSVLEAWDYRGGQLTLRWHFDSSDSSENNNKDGNPNSAYAGQGNHSLNVADLDGDGFDEVMYGSMALDHDGYGLWTTGLGHGDANHVGKFMPDREGLQMYHCLESGTTQVALHDAATGETLWAKVADSSNDTGRCLIDDIYPDSPGCEMWYYGSNAFSLEGKDLGFKPTSCNMSIWFDGSLSRQLINENIIASEVYGRTFTIYRYDETFINSSKSNPCWYGDLVGDWREEFIVPNNNKLENIKIFATWYPSGHKFPWLMTDHCYEMSALNENIGYNQPTHTGYYLGTDLTSDEEAWVAAGYVVAIKEVKNDIQTNKSAQYYSLTGQRLQKAPTRGIYIYNGKKYIAK